MGLQQILALFLFFLSLSSAGRPNIVFIVADDLGWNDVGFRNPDMKTPNIDKLATEGIIFENAYVQPLCSPSRTAFMSGMYPFHAGMQLYDGGLSINESGPDKPVIDVMSIDPRNWDTMTCINQVSESDHQILLVAFYGKHGLLKTYSTPDLHVIQRIEQGIHTSDHDHMALNHCQNVCVPLNYTFLPQELKKLGYATHIIGKWHLGFCKWECTPTYRGFDTFFGYYNAAEDYFTHTAGGYLDFRDNKLPARNYSGEYSAFTFAQRAIDIIHRHDVSQPLFMYLPYQSVHAPIEVPKKYEDMYPNVMNEGRRKYSGMVSALDEAVGNVTQALKDRGLFENTLILFTADEIHAVDWKPTLVSAAGGTPEPYIDGMSLWDSIRNGRPSPRTEFIYNIDYFEIPMEGHAGIRVGDYKLILGYPGELDGWYRPMNRTQDDIYEEPVYIKGDEPVQLFNIREDPTERNDLAQKTPDMVLKLRARFEEYKKTMVPANYPNPDPASDSRKYGGVWSPGWC